MKAVVYDSYGPPGVFRIEDVEPPVPAADEILVQRPRDNGEPHRLPSPRG
jgi:D-arabinose 1-dehydrogenase-like Zn-dependent alcohol dehydrogenase